MENAPLDPTYGYTRERLLHVPVPAPPEDFTEFWTDLHRRARDVDPAPRILRMSAESPSHRILDIELVSLDGFRVGGWLRLPTDGPVERGLVIGHGYGGRLAPDPEIPAEHAAALFFCARGIPARSTDQVIPGDPSLHVLHGIGSRDTYVLGGCAADLWCAITALTELVPESCGRIDYLGGSFGGGIGALAVPWDDRLSAACLMQPTFGNQPLRLTMPCTGSGEAVRMYARSNPAVLEVLPYFDAATAASFITIPTHVAAALADPAVPPPGQFAVYNALRGPRDIFVMSAGHVQYREMQAELHELLKQQRAFLA